MNEAIYKDDLAFALKTLKNGGIILYPTDTIWGIGCDATNSEAVKKVYELKKRSDTKNMLVLVNSTFMLERYTESVPEIAFDLIELTEKPLTIVYEKGKNLAKNLLADDGSIGIRLSNEEFSNRLITMFKKPLVSTSANLSGKKSPGNFSEIENYIIDNVDYVVKYKSNDKSIARASGIIKLMNNGTVNILRE